MGSGPDHLRAGRRRNTHESVASWFVIGKHRIRKRMVEQSSFEDHSIYLYTSLFRV